MNEIFNFGKILVVIGVILAVVGLLFMLGGKIPWLGRLPGDFLVKGKNFTFYFPLTTCIIVSIVLSILMYLFFRK